MANFEELQRQQDHKSGALDEEIYNRFGEFNSHIVGIKAGKTLQEKIKKWYLAYRKKHYKEIEKDIGNNNVAELVEYYGLLQLRPQRLPE